MFETLDGFDWASVRHAYGPATDVPALLRDVAQSDPDTFNEELGELANAINHQTSIYEATSHVVPYLIELLTDGPAHARAGLLYFLRDLAAYASPKPEPLFSNREIKPVPDERAYAEYRESMIRQFGEGFSFARPIYEEARKGIPVYLPFLADLHPEVRTASAHLLSEFAEDAGELAPRLVSGYESEQDEIRAAEVLDCLGRLVEAGLPSIGDTFPYVDLFKAALERDSKYIQFSAASALAPLLRAGTSYEAISILKGGILNPVAYSSSTAFPSSSNTASSKLVYVGREKGLPALLDVLERVEEEPYRPFEIKLAERVSRFGRALGTSSQPGGTSGIGSMFVRDARENILEAILDLAFDGKQVGGWTKRSFKDKDGVYVTEVKPPGEIKYVQDGIWRTVKLTTPTPVPVTTPTPEQKQALNAIVNNDPLWQTRTNIFLLYGLPSEREALRKLSAD